MKLPAEVKTKWVEALRSGQYNQYRGALCNDDGTGHCCLGVLQDVTEGKVEKDMYEENDDGEYRLEPSLEFWSRIGAEVAGAAPDLVSAQDKNITQLMRMNDGMSWYDRKKSKMVQTRKCSFNKIADWIEKNIKVID